jgi:hypothetical protein
MGDVPTAVSSGAYTGPMSAEQIQALRGLQAYIDHCIEDGLTFRTALRDLAQDINAILGGSPGRLKGPARFAEEMRAMADDPEIQRELRAIEAESSGRTSDSGAEAE